MPRNVRNFWVELDVDGSKKQIASGPQKADGGINIRILQRDNGGIITALVINGIVTRDGEIRLMATAPGDHSTSLDVITKR